MVGPVNARDEAIKGRLRGIPTETLARNLGLKNEEVEEYFRDYLEENYSRLGEVEMRLMQLARLESLINVLVDRVNNIHLDEEGKQAAVLLKVIEAINNLMGLHRDPLRQAQVDLTRAQTELVHTMMAELRGQMLERTMAGVRAVLREFDLREDQVELVRTGLESAWGGWFRDAYDVSVKTIKEVEG